MSRRSYRIAGAVAGMLGVMVATVLASALALAQTQAPPSASQIFDALKPVIKTRGLDPKAADEKAFINSLRARKVRSITLVEREKLDEVAKTKPKIALEIGFDYNSDVVGPNAVQALINLGVALSKDELKGSVFAISGHTDGKGGDQFNQDLSERRAEAVKRLLVKQFNLADNTLIAVGYGKSRLKNTADPLAGENRRVQIVNTEVK
jgi:outer membrane protein OmpA-like peptidoglycan-associated protein